MTAGQLEGGSAGANSYAFRNVPNKRGETSPRVIYRDHEVEIAKSLMPSWKNPAMFKTHLCQFYTKHGYCRHEEFCWYAHSEEELRPLPKHGRPVAPILPEILGPLPVGVTTPIELDDFAKTPSGGEEPVDTSVPFAPTAKPAHFALPIIAIKVPRAPIRINVSRSAPIVSPALSSASS
ncbi:hypothetical protein QR680_009475 [Steinernema hermaphroditum]|uniref:C3H1-type domain-containing protein n=1 Tax=Steinernema hermaphroditum TaxID=289476 RepID=A0AA39M9S0_9BILA|nr:hypothetical protein QR680_009475 [Steinernema hermaphroditum]